MKVTKQGDLQGICNCNLAIWMKIEAMVKGSGCLIEYIVHEIDARLLSKLSMPPFRCVGNQSECE